MDAPEALRPIAEAIRARGGRAVVVGGYVRDRLLGSEAKDLDVEVLGLGADALREVLAGFGAVQTFGRAFAVMRVRSLAADFVLPRLPAGSPPDFALAARGRDLTINAIGLDPLTGEILDPTGGRADIEARVLRAADATRFAEDPLRGLRVMQLAARLEMKPDAELVALCGGLDLTSLPGDRLRTEFDRLLLEAAHPSRGLALLEQTGMLRFFPELAALVGVAQDPEWHPEGDVWTHTLMALDAAAELRRGEADDAALLYAVLCHDFGKPAATREIDGRIRAPDHESAGVEATQRFLARLNAPNALLSRVAALVEHHLAPVLLPGQGAKPKAYRRLARKLADAGVSPALLERVARADQWGRTTPEARARRFSAGDAFLAAVADADIPDTGPRDVVLGRHLLARGHAPGPSLGRVLARCREIQDETGWTDADAILERALDGDRA
jgi:tRNA nucleotidyltransferase (CCA-adding enzyme)